MTCSSRQLARAAVALCAAGCVVLTAGCGGETTSDEGGWVRHDDRSAGLTVLFPEEWNRARTSLTPRLQEPAELLSLGTHRLRPGAVDCSQMAGFALDDMSELDAFVTVQERTLVSGEQPSVDDFPLRPDDLALEPKDASVGAACSDNTGIQTWWVPFRDAGRAFYLQVAIGKSASEDTRRQVLGIVESLSFIERPPTVAGAAPSRAGGQRGDGRRVRRIPNVSPT